QIVETLRRSASAHVPRRRVAAVEANVRDRRRRRDERLRDVLAAGARRVDDDPGHTPLLEEAKQLRAYVLRVPRLMARFEQEHVVADLVARPLEVVERR